MKNINTTKTLLIIVTAITLFSCKKDTIVEQTPAITEPTTTNVKLNFTNVVDNSVLKISSDDAYTITTPKYLNAFGDTFAVSSFKYYISNIKLKKSNGTYFVEPESYHLIDAGDTNTTCKINIANVPIDNYVSIEFLLGIDSTRNVSGSQTGDLDPAHGMYWAWNQGYIFMRFFGYSSSAPQNTSHNITYEIGEYTSACKISLPFASTNFNSKNNGNSIIYLKSNLAEVFKSPNTISFNQLNIAMVPRHFRPLVENYGDMFSIVSIK